MFSDFRFYYKNRQCWCCLVSMGVDIADHCDIADRQCFYWNWAKIISDPWSFHQLWSRLRWRNRSESRLIILIIFISPAQFSPSTLNNRDSLIKVGMLWHNRQSNPPVKWFDVVVVNITEAEVGRCKVGSNSGIIQGWCSGGGGRRPRVDLVDSTEYWRVLLVFFCLASIKHNQLG